MSATHESGRVRRIAVELVIVFVGVLFALAADDLREQWSEAAEARQSLALLLEDLYDDSLEFAQISEGHEAEVEGIAWLTEQWERSAMPMDSVGEVFWSVGITYNATPSQSAYVGLERANRLRLLSPDSLQDALGQYYQGRQPIIFGYQRQTADLGRELNRNFLGRYIVDLPAAEPGTMWPISEERVEVRAPWDEIRSDLEFRHLLVTLGRRLQFGSGMFREGEGATGNLMEMIRIELGG